MSGNWNGRRVCATEFAPGIDEMFEVGEEIDVLY